jgi:hypothetical protein
VAYLGNDVAVLVNGQQGGCCEGSSHRDVLRPGSEHRRDISFVMSSLLGLRVSPRARLPDASRGQLGQALMTSTESGENRAP